MNNDPRIPIVLQALVKEQEVMKNRILFLELEQENRQQCPQAPQKPQPILTESNMEEVRKLAPLLDAILAIVSGKSRQQ